jgi:hypothetical protein
MDVELIVMESWLYRVNCDGIMAVELIVMESWLCRANCDGIMAVLVIWYYALSS